VLAGSAPYISSMFEGRSSVPLQQPPKKSATGNASGKQNRTHHITIEDKEGIKHTMINRKQNKTAIELEKIGEEDLQHLTGGALNPNIAINTEIRAQQSAGLARVQQGLNNRQQIVNAFKELPFYGTSLPK
jgi:hypothetical protein